MIILDTHAWIFWLTDEKLLGKNAINFIQKADQVYISVFTYLETGILIRKNKIKVELPPTEWFEKIKSIQNCTVLPLTPDIAYKSAIMVNFHADPADRVIVNTCIEYQAKLITKDRKIIESGLVETIW